MKEKFRKFRAGGLVEFVKDHEEAIITAIALTPAIVIPFASLIIVHRNTRGYQVIYANIIGDDPKKLYLWYRNGSVSVHRPVSEK